MFDWSQKPQNFKTIREKGISTSLFRQNYHNCTHNIIDALSPNIVRKVRGTNSKTYSLFSPTFLSWVDTIQLQALITTYIPNSLAKILIREEKGVLQKTNIKFTRTNLCYPYPEHVLVSNPLYNITATNKGPSFF